MTLEDRIVLVTFIVRFRSLLILRIFLFTWRMEKSTKMASANVWYDDEINKPI